MHQHLSFPPAPTCSKRTVLAGMIGNVMEWYDFALFGFMAPILSPLFFPSQDRFAGLLATYGVFAIGFLMRPLGGIFFGHIGDRLGRKKALLWSILLMALPTTLLGLLPTYAQVGLLAPLLLTLIRMLQGLSVGGEYVGSTTFLGEQAPANRRGYFATWPTTSATFGN
ncbi:MAG TPA: MFS transporter, partial [Pirellulales bacterium]